MSLHSAGQNGEDIYNKGFSPDVRVAVTLSDFRKGCDRAIHNIENAPFRTKFDRDVADLEGNIGIGCISDYEPQPLLVHSHLGSFAITTVGKINNMVELQVKALRKGYTHFLEMSGGEINATELCAALINEMPTIPEGIRNESVSTTL